jgi:uncharacterized protein YutE (UPF0331/DUF86 family)
MDKLAEEISIEREYIQETLEVLQDALSRPEKGAIELSAIGACLHHCYNGMENILKRILTFKKVPLYDSVSSHKDLLDVAIQKDIISNELSERLDTYRGFRHFFVHSYGILLQKEELNPLAKELPGVWAQFDNEIQEFLTMPSSG